MAANWPKLPALNSPDELEELLPEGWRLDKIENLYEQLPVGKRFDQKSSKAQGKVPVIDQSEAGVIGWHDEEPGVMASDSRPVVTFANHTCEMRLMRRPFSVIQNVFPLVGRSDVCDTRFLYYGTKGRVHLEEYKGHFPDYRRKWIPVPPLPEQRAIAHILGTLDDKIELNRRMSQTLEAMARALFKAWFVHFEPVRAKMEGRWRRGQSIPGLPADLYDLFPDRLVDSELGEIPDGWTCAELKDALEIADGRPLPPERRNDAGPVEVFGANGVIGRTDVPSVDSPCVILGKIGTCGSLHRSARPCWVTNNAFAIRAGRSVSLEFAWWLLSGIDFSQFVSGSANPYMPLKNFGHYKVILPTTKLLREFQIRAGVFRRQVDCLNAESRTLAALRDALLPKLISGEIRVKDAEKFIRNVL
jgi:type I restriction enzyme S subunit